MKNYVITGSTGHISKPIAEALIKAGKHVTIVTSTAEKVKEIEALGARASVGSLSDAKFLNEAFASAEVVYTMIPPIWQTTDWRASQLEISKNYINAITTNKIKYVVNLSSVGAHLGQGCGPVDGIHDFEQLLNKLEGVSVKHLRPASFYYNFFNMIGMIKQAGILGANYGDGKLGLVHTKDIAKAAVEELLNLTFKGNSIRTIVGDFRTGKEIAAVLGQAIGKQIPWIVFTDEQQLDGYLKAGISQTHAKGYTDMGTGLRSGKMQEEIIGKPTNAETKLEDFVPEFVKAFNG